MLTIIKRECALAIAEPFALLQPLLFFILVVSLFPLASDTTDSVLQQQAPGVIWVAALFAMLLSQERLFQNDYQYGFLDQLILAPQSLTGLVLAKFIAHWLLTGLPLILLSPLLAMLFHLPLQTLSVLCITLLLGTPVLIFVGGMVGALTVGLSGNSLLLPLLILPLMIPILIFATSAVSHSLQGMPVGGELALLAALFFVFLPLAPWGAAFALRIGVN